MSTWQILLAALVGGAAAIERRGVLQAQWARPIVFCSLLGWTLGDPLGGLLIGAPLELLWIGAASLGAASTEHDLVVSAAVSGTAISAGIAAASGVTGDLAVISFLLLAPLSAGWKSVGRLEEHVAERAVEKARLRIEKGDIKGGLRLHLLPMWLSFFAMFLVVLISVSALGPLLARLRFSIPPMLLWLASVAWVMVWAAGGGAAILVGRGRRGVWIGALGLVFFLGLFLLLEGG